MTLLAIFLAANAAAAMPADEIVVRAWRAPYRAERVSVRRLAAMRGGLQLPNGLNVAIGVDIQTRVDGVLALHTLYASEGQQTGVRVFTDGTAPTPAVPALTTVDAPAQSGAPDVTIDRSPAGPRIQPVASSAEGTVNFVNGIQATWATAAGQTEVPVTPNGPPVAGPPGAFSLKTDNDGSVVTLAAPDLEIRHLIGSATGIVVANSADNRVIDTVSAVNVDLRGAELLTLPPLMAVENLALQGLRTGR